MDDHLEQCSSCGHAVGLGLYCTSCGQLQDDVARDDVRETAERAAVPAPPPLYPPPVTSPSSDVPPRPAGPVAALPTYEPPRPPRFPLFADEAPVTPAASPDLVEVTVGPVQPPPAPRRGRIAVGLGWAAAVIAVVGLLGVGGFLLLDGAGPDSARESDAPSTAAEDDSGAGGPASQPADPATSEGGGKGKARRGGKGDDSAKAEAEPVDVARLAEATAPETAEPSRDVDGNVVRYEAFNMLDGQPDTAWRTAGDGSGDEIAFRLAAPTTISRVGLINGYAKVTPGYDGYAANRRVTAVEWVFDDGSVVPQSLTDGLAVQSVKVRRVVSSTVTLRIVSVSAPAKGPSGRDYTAISDVSLVGSPA